MEFNEKINEILEKDFVFVDEANKKKDTRKIL